MHLPCTAARALKSDVLSSDFPTSKDSGVVATATAAWSTATGIEVTAADVTAAAWSKTATFTWSNTAASSSSDTISSTRTRRRIGALRLVVAVRQHSRIRWNQHRIGNYSRCHRQRRILDLWWLRIRRHYLRNYPKTPGEPYQTTRALILHVHRRHRRQLFQVSACYRRHCPCSIRQFLDLASVVRQEYRASARPVNSSSVCANSCCCLLL